MKKITFCLVMLLGILLASCGGGGGVSIGGSGGGGAGGVGSGGTGIVAGFSVGPITGFGSIIVNGTTYDVDTATVTLEDAAALQLGMVVEVRGTIDTATGRGTAARVFSAADLRGPVASIDAANARFGVLGTTVRVDNATVWEGVANLAALTTSDTVQVYGLLESIGTVRATRVEKITGAAAPVLSGTIANLDAAARSFDLGGLRVQYGSASFGTDLTAAHLANGVQVRVRATAAPVAGVLQASSVQPWYPLPTTGATAVDLAGVIDNYTGPQAFTVLGTPVNAATAHITGGPSSGLGNGVTVEVSGTLQNGVLVAERLKIRHVPGTGGPVSFELTGPVGAYSSAASFRVRGQPVDANGPGVVFSGGSAADLHNGVQVHVVGAEVIAGVLQAQRVSFVP